MMSTIERNTRLFTLRIWAEPTEDHQVEWRGKLQALPDGEAYFFRGLAGLVMRLESMLDSGGSAGHLSSQEEKGEQS